MLIILLQFKFEVMTDIFKLEEALQCDTLFCKFPGLGLWMLFATIFSPVLQSFCPLVLYIHIDMHVYLYMYVIGNSLLSNIFILSLMPY